MGFFNSRKHRFTRYAALVTVGAALSAVSMVLVSGSIGKVERPQPDYWGSVVQLDPGPATASVKVDVRENCKIGAFGTAPVRHQREGFTAEWEIGMRRAIAQMYNPAIGETGVPPAVVEMAIAKFKSLRSDYHLALGNTHAEMITVGKLFLPQSIMTYRVGETYSVCRNTVTQFPSNQRTEFATLHRIEHNGAVYWFGEVHVCRNVYRVYPAPPGWLPRGGLPKPSVVTPGAVGQPKKGGAGNLMVVNEVPEPATIALMGIGVIGLFLTRRK